MLAKIGLAADAGIGCVGGSVSLIAFPCALRLRVTSLRLPAPVISRGKIGGWGWRHIHRYESGPVILGPSLRIEWFGCRWRQQSPGKARICEVARSEERRVGNEWVRTCRSRGSADQ